MNGIEARDEAGTGGEIKCVSSGTIYKIDAHKRVVFNCQVVSLPLGIWEGEFKVISKCSDPSLNGFDAADIAGPGGEIEAANGQLIPIDANGHMNISDLGLNGVPIQWFYRGGWRVIRKGSESFTCKTCSNEVSAKYFLQCSKCISNNVTIEDYEVSELMLDRVLSNCCQNCGEEGECECNFIS